MPFIKEYGIIAAIIGTLTIIGIIWVTRGNYDSANMVSDTQKTVAPIQMHEEAIGRVPLNGSQLLDSLRHSKY